MEFAGMGVELGEQIDRLAAVDLGNQTGRKQRKSQRVRPTRIPLVDRRLGEWGEWMLSEGMCAGTAVGRSPLYSIMQNMGETIRGTNPSEGAMPDDVYDVDRVVNRLDEGDQEVVRLQYLNLSLTLSERAERMGLKARAFNERVAKVHQKIFMELKPSKRKG